MGAPAFGEAIFFVSLFVLTILMGVCVLTYMAHCFLVVVENTAAGNDVVDWPDEPYLDWVWKVFYLTWLAGIGAGVSWLLLRPVRAWQGNEFLLLKALLAMTGTWVLFPVCLLSSLSGGSVWMVFRWTVLGRLIRNPLTVLSFYAVSAVLLAGLGLLGGLAVAGPPWWLLPVAGPVLAAGWLIYGRLLGRLAWVVLQGEPEEETESPPPPAAPAGPKPLPKIVTESPPATTLPVEGYGVQDVEAPPPVLSLLGSGEGTNGTPPPGQPGRKRKRQRISPPPPPRWPLVSGVYTFPWYPSSLKVWIWLSLGLMFVGGLARGLQLAVFW